MNPLFLRSQLFDPAGETNSGGGGAGSGAGVDANTGGGAPNSAYVTEEKLNAAISGVAKRITGEFGKSFDSLKSILDTLKPKGDDGSGGGSGNSNSGQPPQNSGQQKTPEQLRYERDLAELRAKAEAADKRSIETEKAREREAEKARKVEIDAKLSSSLTGIEFLEGMGQDAFHLIRPHLSHTEDGKIVAGEAQLPVEQYVKDWLKTRPNYLRGKDVGGAGGAIRGSSASGSGKTVDYDKIGPGMKPEDTAQALAEIRAAMGL